MLHQISLLMRNAWITCRISRMKESETFWESRLFWAELCFKVCIYAYILYEKNQVLNNIKYLLLLQFSNWKFIRIMNSRTFFSTLNAFFWNLQNRFFTPSFFIPSSRRVTSLHFSRKLLHWVQKIKTNLKIAVYLATL